MSEAAGNGVAVGLYLGGRCEESEEGEAGDGPEGFEALPSGGSGHAPADEDGAAEIESAIKLKVDIPWFEEGMREGLGAERGGGAGKEEVPAQFQQTERQPQRAASRRRGVRLKTAQGARALKDRAWGWEVMAWTGVSVVPRRARAADGRRTGVRPRVCSSAVRSARWSLARLGSGGRGVGRCRRAGGVRGVRGSGRPRDEGLTEWLAASWTSVEDELVDLSRVVQVAVRLERRRDRWGLGSSRCGCGR